MERRRARMRLALASFVALLPAAWMHPAEGREQASWFWEWSDGSTARARTLSESTYAVWSRLPTIMVASTPPAAGRTVSLQVRQAGAWLTEDTARTDAEGRAELTLNPYCHGGDWCDGPVTYRLVADADKAALRVTFTPRRPSP